MPDRLLVDLGGDGQTVISWAPRIGPTEHVSRQALAWPLDSEALEDLRWYLEDYLQAPLGVWEQRGPAVARRLPEWGKLVFDSVFGSEPARACYQQASERGLEVLFRSAQPGPLALPWELMRDESGAVALGAGGISRSLLIGGGAAPLEVPGGKLRVLMVISRPAGTADVAYQMVARPLVERLDAVRGEVELTVLRPPTFKALRQAVTQAAQAGSPFHVVHFDGHGVMPGRLADSVAQGQTAMIASPGEGMLAFELPHGGGNPVGASRIAAVLAGGGVPVVVLNACQSGAVGKELEASVATALLQAGCSAVVAMAYNVYAVAAAEFMASFYESLFAGESVGEAVVAGRRRLSEHDGRPSPKGDMPLADWVVPVHYQRAEVRFSDARTTRSAAAPSLDEALDLIRSTPPKVDAVQDPLAAVDGVFVGRDDLFYQMEASARLQRVVVLFGPGGTGKTELARGFARWWRDTGGTDDPRLVLWHSFEPGLASIGLDGVIAGIGLEVFGTDFARLETAQQLAAVKELLAQYRALLVWDNFESVKEMPGQSGVTPSLDEVGRARLRNFLDWVRDHSASTVIITSRTGEDWLGQVRRIEVGGLNPVEAAQYAGYLLAPFPATRERREQRSFGELLQWLHGHPLSMRLILPRLDTTDPEALLASLRGIVPLPGGEAGGDRLSTLAGCITYSFAHLGEQTRRLLPALSLFHGIAEANLLTLLSAGEGVPGRFAGITKQEWTEMLRDAARVGLLTRISASMYEIHPALPGYLTAVWQDTSPGNYDHEREACEQALCMASVILSQWVSGQIESGNAASAYTVIGLQRRTLAAMLGRALDRQAWEEAAMIIRALDSYWKTRGLREEADAWTDRIMAATASAAQHSAEAALSLRRYTIGRRANRQLEAGQVNQAEQYYRQILADLQDQPETEWNRGNIATVYHQLGRTAQDRGQLDEAEDWHRRALTIAEALDDRPRMALTYHELGMVAQHRGQLDEAQDFFRQALTIKERLGDRPGIADTYHQLGVIAYLRQRLDEAEDLYRQALTIYKELGSRHYESFTYHELGMVARDRGRLDEAEDLYRQALTIKERLGDRSGMALTYHELGVIAHDRRRLDEAENWYRQALTIGEELGDRPGIAMTYGQLGLLAETRQQPRQALEWVAKCVMLFSQFPHPSTGPAPSHLARLTRQLGMPALEETWQQLTGQPVPQPVRDYVTSSHEKEPADRS